MNRNSTSKMFVTGGNGFIGSSVVRHLLKQGYAVRCLLRPTSNTQRLADLQFERIIGDIRDLDILIQGMQGCNGVIHLAGLSNWKEIQSPLLGEVVVGGSQNVLQAAQQNGNLRTIVVSSVVAVNGTTSPQLLNEDSPFSLPNTPEYAYAWVKRRVEQLCREAATRSLPVIIVNPVEVYGPDDQDLITAGNLIDIAQLNPVPIIKGGASIVHFDDVAAGIIKAWEHGQPGERYILGGDNLTLRELVTLVLELLGQQKRMIAIPTFLIKLIVYVGQRLSLPLPLNPAIIPYAVRYWFVDNTKARQELDVQFRSARQTLAPTLEWLVENGYIEDR